MNWVERVVLVLLVLLGAAVVVTMLALAGVL